jgi:biopolymer transport protein ExbB
MFEQVLQTRLRLNGWLPFVAICATSAPLLGLLGTVTGIMGSFSSIGGSELAVEKVTGGIGEALIATAFGLGIAIITLIPYNWFHSKVASLQHDIETAANNVEVFTAQKK